MGRLSYTWTLMKASWEVLKKDRELLLFSLLSGICCVVVLASFAVPLFLAGKTSPPSADASAAQQVFYYGTLFLFYLCTYFVIVFFNTAIISCAIIRMKGGDPTLGDGFNAAFSRLPYIAGWALLAATVGLVLRILEDRSERAGRFVAGLLGMAWSIVTFLAVPVLVVEKKGPIDAFKESAGLLKKTWGQQIAGNFSFGLIFLFLQVPAGLLLFLGALLGGPFLVLMVVLAVLYFIIVSLVQSTLQTIFQAAVYLYAREGISGEGFDEGMLRNAVRVRT